MVYEIISLIILLFGLVFASISDLKKREVPNWLSFSLISAGLSLSIFRSISESRIDYFLLSFLSVIAFVLFGNLMYYTGQWGGGDAKLLMGFAALLPVYPSVLFNYFNPNLNFHFLFITVINIFIVGSIYGVFYMLYLMGVNHKKFSKQFKQDINHYKLNYYILFTLLFLVVSSLLLPIYFSIPLTLALVILLFVFFSMKSLEKVAMIKEIKAKNLVEGDWILQELKFKGKVIYTPESQGVTKKKLLILKEKYPELKVIVKDGLPFVPGITLAIIITLIYGNFIASFLT